MSVIEYFRGFAVAMSINRESREGGWVRSRGRRELGGSGGDLRLAQPSATLRLALVQLRNWHNSWAKLGETGLGKLEAYQDIQREEKFLSSDERATVLSTMAMVARKGRRSGGTWQYWMRPFRQ